MTVMILELSMIQDLSKHYLIALSPTLMEVIAPHQRQLKYFLNFRRHLDPDHHPPTTIYTMTVLMPLFPPTPTTPTISAPKTLSSSAPLTAPPLVPPPRPHQPPPAPSAIPAARVP